MRTIVDKMSKKLTDIKELLVSKDEQISFLLKHNKWLKDNNDKLLIKINQEKVDN